MDATTTTRVRGAGAFSGSDAAVAVVVGVLGYAGIGSWLTGQLAALLFHQAWPDVTLDQGFTIAVAIPRHAADPREAWPAPVQRFLPGPVGFYLVGVIVFAVLAVLIVLVCRWARTSRSTAGMASGQQLDAKLSAAAVRARAARIRPTLQGTATLADVAVELGSAGRRKLYADLESSVLMAAPPRQGKTSQAVIPWLRSFPGAAVVTSVRSDVLDATAMLRQGTPWVLNLDTDFAWPHHVQWSPIAGCQDFDLARRRADVMIRVGKAEAADSSNAGFFGMTATNLMAAWLHTAAICGKTMRDVRGWATNPHDDTPVTLLRQAEGVQEGVAHLLDSIYRQPESTRSNLWTTVQTGTSCLYGKAAERVFCGDPAASFDIPAFLQSGHDTIYLIVDEDQANDLAPLVTAFVKEIVTVAKRLARAQDAENGRLDPPLALILDEVTNVVPLPDLPALMSNAAGFGIFVVAVLQNLAAAERRWRREGRKELWSNATVKIALGGLAGDDLDDFSQLAGTYRETILIPQRHGETHHVQASVSDRRTLSVDRIRLLDEDKHEALIIQATTPPVIVRMVRHHESKARKDYQQAVTWAKDLKKPKTSPQPSGAAQEAA
jgi:type IV secretory pathway TraG/TraD family ATPase VirD4